MSLLASLAPRGESGFGYGSTAMDVTNGLSLAGRVVLVTGCSSGIGRETARVLALRGARVIGTARTVDKETRDVVACDLADLSSVRACAKAVREMDVKLDALICNAGIMALPERREVNGVELQMLTNHVGHFLLVTSLLDTLHRDGRVVMVSSAAHRRAPPCGIELDNLSGARDYDPWKAYGQSKLANILFAKELARRTGRIANALHPGVIATNLTRHMPPLARGAWSVAGAIALKSVAQGAATSCYVAAHPNVASISGAYLADCNVAEPRRIADDVELARELWRVTEQIVGP